MLSVIQEIRFSMMTRIGSQQLSSKIAVSLPNGLIYDVKLSKSMTILKIKESIEKSKAILVKDQELSLFTIVLNDEEFLGSKQINPNSFLVLTPKDPGIKIFINSKIPGITFKEPFYFSKYAGIDQIKLKLQEIHFIPYMNLTLSFNNKNLKGG